MESSRSEERAVSGSVDGAVVRACQVSSVSLRSALDVLPKPRLAWATGTDSVVAGGATKTLTASGPGRFETVRDEATQLFDRLTVVDSAPDRARPRLFGGFAFTDVHSDPPRGATWHGFPGASFVLPAVQCTVTPDGAWLTATATGAEAEQTATRRLQRWQRRLDALPELERSTPPGIVSRQYTTSREEWATQVETATDSISQGNLQKVVLAQSLTATLDRPATVPDALARLGEQYPGCSRFLFDFDDGGAFFGATPERLVSVDGNTVETEALAGSTGRGDTPEEDEWLASELADSEKDAHEHELVVETIRDQLDPLTTEVRTGKRTVRQLATVQHLQTPIRGELTQDEHVLSLVRALHPTPAVGGLPPDAALRSIRESETFDRGWYAAPVGWIDADGNGTFAVAIRSAIADGRTATLFAGAGIVADSDPDREWDELQLKYRPILDQLA